MGFLPVECVPALRSREKDFVLVSLVLSSRAPPDAAAPDFFFPVARFYAEFPLGPAGGRPNRDVAVATARTADYACCGTTAAWRTNHIKKITKRI